MCVGYPKIRPLLFYFTAKYVHFVLEHFLRHTSIKSRMCLRHNNNQHIHHVCHQNMGDMSESWFDALCTDGNMYIQQGWAGAKLKPLIVLTWSHSPLQCLPQFTLHFCQCVEKAGWGQAVTHAHTSNHCHQSKRKRWKASEFRRRNSTVESALQIIFIFKCPKYQADSRTKAGVSPSIFSSHIKH